VHLPISFYYKVAKLHRFHIHASIEAFYGHYTNLRIINLKCIPVANLGYTISPSPCWKQLLNFGCLRESGPQVFMNEFPHCSFEASNRAGDLTAFMQQIPDTRIVIRVNATKIPSRITALLLQSASQPAVALPEPSRRWRSMSP
jgi:hypothetical protein